MIFFQLDSFLTRSILMKYNSTQDTLQNTWTEDQTSRQLYVHATVIPKQYSYIYTDPNWFRTVEVQKRYATGHISTEYLNTRVDQQTVIDKFCFSTHTQPLYLNSVLTIKQKKSLAGN